MNGLGFMVSGDFYLRVQGLGCRAGKLWIKVRGLGFIGFSFKTFCSGGYPAIDPIKPITRM